MKILIRSTFSKFGFNIVRTKNSHDNLILIYKGMTQVDDLLKEFHNSNFFISGMYPINRHESLAVMEYDSVMVKT